MSASYDFDLLCIGSGPAGQRAAIQASSLANGPPWWKNVLALEASAWTGGLFRARRFAKPSVRLRRGTASLAIPRSIDLNRIDRAVLLRMNCSIVSGWWPDVSLR